MYLSSPVCNKFERLLNDEIAFAESVLDDKVEEGLKKSKYVGQFGEQMSINYGITNRPVTMWDTEQEGVKALKKMRFIYLTSQLEAFFKEYIAYRSGINMDNYDNKQSIKPESTQWNKMYDGKKSSTSLLNVHFAGYLFKERFGIDFSQILNPATMEMGQLRDCIVHDLGKVKSSEYASFLQNTSSYLNVTIEKGSVIEINGELMWLFIEDLRNLFKECDNAIK